VVFFFSSRRRHTRSTRDWSSDVCSSDLRPFLLTPTGLTEEGAAANLPTISEESRTPQLRSVRRPALAISFAQLAAMSFSNRVTRSEERRVGKEGRSRVAECRGM